MFTAFSWIFVAGKAVDQFSGVTEIAFSVFVDARAEHTSDIYSGCLMYICWKYHKSIPTAFLPPSHH